MTDLLIPVLQESLYDHYNIPRKGVHITDIVGYCPRVQAFRRIDPLPVTVQQLNYFIIGQSSHAAAQILANRYPKRYDIEKEIIYQDFIYGHVDLYDKLDNIPIEMKTYRGADATKPKEHQVQQLKAYQSILDADRGIICYLLMNNFKEPLFREYVITMSAEERKSCRESLVNNAKLFQEAIRTRDASLSPHVYYDKILNDNHWMCEGYDKKSGRVIKKCAYYDECRKMREQETPNREP